MWEWACTLASTGCVTDFTIKTQLASWSGRIACRRHRWSSNQRKYSARMSCHLSGCSICTKLETSTWFYIPNRKNTQGWELGGGNTSNPMYYSCNVPVGDFMLSVPTYTSELCKVSSLDCRSGWVQSFQEGCSKGTI